MNGFNGVYEMSESDGDGYFRSTLLLKLCFYKFPKLFLIKRHN